MIKILVTLLFAFSTHAFGDEILRVQSPEKGFFASSAETEIVFWENNPAKGTIVFLPGGDGNFNVTPMTNRAGRMSLIRSVFTVPNWNGAFVNSPYQLASSTSPSVSARFTDAHLNRVIESIVAIKQRTDNKPVWLHGHSNGTVSAFAAYTRLQQLNKEHLIAGIIVSGSRDAIELPKQINVPVLFIHHTLDQCPFTSYSTALRTFELAKARSSKRIEFAAIQENPTGGGCHSGSHMFHELHNELASTVSKFINQ